MQRSDTTVVRMADGVLVEEVVDREDVLGVMIGAYMLTDDNKLIIKIVAE